MNRLTRQTFRVLVLLLLGAMVFAGCGDESQRSVQTRPQDLVESASDHMGETVSISGEISRVFSNRSFTIGGEDFGQELLIVSGAPIAPVEGRTEEIPAVERDVVQVTGVVQRFDSSEFAEE